MNDSLYFRLVLLTVFTGALLAVFDPANRSTNVAASQPAASAQSSPAQPAPAATTYHLASSN
jgi:hypothetical protein